ncbi:MAG: SHOCT domain-containing protein [Candidatus Hydrothermarchaeales archaeon]
MIDMFGVFGLGWMLMGGVFMILFWVAVILLIIWLYRQITGAQGVVQADSALEILKQRYARGEIGKEEFEKMKKDLLT